MPFKSEAQRRFMHAKHPKIAKRWEEHTPKGKKLPERVRNESILDSINAISEILFNDMENGLLEDIGPSGVSSVLSGASAAQSISTMEPDSTYDRSGYDNDQEEDRPEYTQLEIRLTNRFMDLVGGAERARDLINKCQECRDCLGITDDADDDGTIEDIARAIPTQSDLPMKNMASSFDPGSNPNYVV